MSADFTLRKYSELLQALHNRGYRFVTFEQYCSERSVLTSADFVILRHDVDMKAENSLATAEIEHCLGVKATYYFRIVEQSNKPEIISKIVQNGHEIGYHYEDMTVCEGNVDKAIEHFKTWLNYFRQFYPVKTICMHGAPRSKYDGKDLWKHYDYHDSGIIGEPYFDVDFSKVFYLTDTGRRWDGFNVSLRDKIPIYQDKWIKQGLVFHNTDDVIKAIKEEKLPKQLMITTHPQRWTDRREEWLGEMVKQSAKNMVKGLMVKRY
jgi:hypothetical protein